MLKICHHIIVLATLCIASVVYTGCETDSYDVNKGVKVGESIPNFEVQIHAPDSLDWRFTGSDFILSSSAFDDNVGVIVFFNTGCEDCQKELPEIQNVYNNIKGNPDYQLICIAREETETDIMKYWRENNLTLPYSAQSDRAIYNLFAETIIPRIYIVKHGQVAYIHTDESLVGSSQLMDEIK